MPTVMSEESVGGSSMIIGAFFLSFSAMAGISRLQHQHHFGDLCREIRRYLLLRMLPLEDDIGRRGSMPPTETDWISFPSRALVF